MPIYFFGFLFAIKKFNIMTPGRDGTQAKMFTKVDYQKLKKEEVKHTTVDEKEHKYRVLAAEVILAYGGAENIKNVDACITKLRIQVADQSKVNADKLRQLGAAGIIKPSAHSVYAVFGTTADILKNKINEILFPQSLQK
jgi:glucose-like phosphotransferase system IIB component